MNYNENLQRNNDELRDILEDVKALPEGTGGVQPDWNQSDPAARDFIKNRPFYDDEKWRIVHEVRQFVSTSTGIDWIIGSDNIFDTVPVGTKCRIVVDGATYIGTMADEHEGTGYYSRYIGNGYLKDSDLPDTGEPFVFFASGLDCMAMIPCDTMPSAATISVLESGELVRIDPKFLPEPVQSDYWQNDPAARDYIKNRPFYEEVTERETTITINPGDVIGASVADQIWAQRETAKYTVDGTNSGLQYWFDVSETEYSLYDGSTAVNVVRSSVDTLTFAISGETVTAGVTCNLRVAEVHKLDPKYLPDEAAARKPLILDANLSDYYGGHPEAGDAVLEAIKTGRQILVRVPNASGDNYVASYSPVYFTQLPLDGQYLYLFYLRDEKQDLSALLGQPAGTVVMPTYGQLQMLLSQRYDSNPLEG